MTGLRHSDFIRFLNYNMYLPQNIQQKKIFVGVYARELTNPCIKQTPGDNI